MRQSTEITNQSGYNNRYCHSEAKSGQDSGLKECAGDGMPKIAIRMERNLGRDHGIGEPYCAVADPEERPRGPAPLIVRVN